MKNKTIIETSTPEPAKKEKSRNKKKDLQAAFLIKGLQTLQYVSPRLTSTIIWNKFTRTPRARFNDNQKSLLEKAEKSTINYNGYNLQAYKWAPKSGRSTARILLAHGWGSKIADFRRMIESLVASGFTVEGIDMKGHGNSPGTHTALPEMRDVLKNHYTKEGPYHAIIGYSIGGLAAGITLNELTPSLHPKHLVLIATPPYTRFFFRDIIAQVGCKERVYEEMCNMVYEHYFQPIDYFDLRNKTEQLSNLDIHMVYEESDKSVPFAKGEELTNAFPGSSFVHVKGTDHNKIIADEKVISYILESVAVKELVE